MDDIVFISGPMSGIKDLNFPAFYAAQELLESQGNICVNPAEVGKELVIPGGLSKEELYLFYLRADIAEMINRGCNTIYLLKGWEPSRGAWVELNTAVALGFKVIYEAECEFHLCGCQGGEICDRCQGTKIVPAIEAEWRILGKNLRMLRADVGLTLSGFAIKHNISMVDLSSAENGRVDPQKYINILEGV